MRFLACDLFSISLLCGVASALMLALTGCTGSGSSLSERSESVTTETQTETQSTSAAETTAAETEPVTESRTLAQLRLDSMTLHEKVCQMFITTPEAFTSQGVYTCADESFAERYGEYPVGGFIFFQSNFIDAEQTLGMTEGTQKSAADISGIGLFLATDEEGGAVTRVQQKLGTAAVESMRSYGELNDREAAFEVGRTIGGYLGEYGFNLDFAPVADVNISPYNELGSRIFSSDPNVVSEMSAAVVEGLHSQGVCSTLKHFPGLGAGSGNTHYGAVVIERTLEELRDTEFPAFSGGIDSGSEFVMVGHQVTTAAGDELPSDLSRSVVTDWLRGELGFEGITITDSHSMGAIQNFYPDGQAEIMSIEAGIDVILMPYSLGTSVAAVENAVDEGRISEERINESVLRILSQKEKMGLISPKNENPYS